MKRAIFSLLLAGMSTLPAFAQCGPWGCPVQRQPAPIYKHKEKTRLNQPTPAWRYVEPIGYRRAVVRVHCWDGGHVWSKGSGVLVRWGKRVVVLTARHVVQDARRILIDFPGGRRSRKVKVIKVDCRWDCAVLNVGDIPDGMEPAEMAYGNEAGFQDGDRLETCGYGPDGKLACNSGLFKGYRHSTEAMEGPDDWMVISGHARSGDSGGPVFDEQGRVVGVLWGADGKDVYCVQPGRIHVLLDEAVAVFEQKQCPGGVCRLPRERRPTPPALGPLGPISEADQAVLAGGRDRTLLPWRKEAEAKDKKQDEMLGRLIALEERQAAGRPAVGVDVSVGQRPEKTVKPDDRQRSPLLGGLCLFAGIIGGFIIYFANQKGE